MILTELKDGLLIRWNFIKLNMKNLTLQIYYRMCGMEQSSFLSIVLRIIADLDLMWVNHVMW